MLIACYGSLKRGFYNHGALGEDAEFLGTTTVRGVMYWNGVYPKLYHFDTEGDVDEANGCSFCYNSSKDHEVEIYKVNDRAYEYIKAMEVGAGYEPERLETEWGTATIYYMPHDNFNSDDEWIEGYTLELVTKHHD